MPQPTIKIIESGSGSYTSPIDCGYIIVEIIGGGGGAAHGRDTGDYLGAGGGSGGYRKSVLPSGNYTYVVGVGGLGGTSDSAPGSAGTATTFHDATVQGGLGASATQSGGGVGGVGGDGTILGSGLLITRDGMRGGGSNEKCPGIGGSTIYGEPAMFKTASNYTGVGYGYGGSCGSTELQDGKNGGNGVIIITEFYKQNQLTLSGNLTAGSVNTDTVNTSAVTTNTLTSDTITTNTLTTNTLGVSSITLPVTNFFTNLLALTNSFTFAIPNSNSITYSVVNNIAFLNFDIQYQVNVNRFPLGTTPAAEFGIVLPLPATSTCLVQFTKSYYGITSPGSTTLRILDFNANNVQLLSGTYTFQGSGFYFV